MITWSLANLLAAGEEAYDIGRHVGVLDVRQASLAILGGLANDVDESFRDGVDDGVNALARSEWSHLISQDPHAADHVDVIEPFDTAALIAVYDQLIAEGRAPGQREALECIAGEAAEACETYDSDLDDWRRAFDEDEDNDLPEKPSALYRDGYICLLKQTAAAVGVDLDDIGYGDIGA